MKKARNTGAITTSSGASACYKTIKYQTVSVKSIINYLLSQDEVEQLFEISEHGDILVY